MDAVPAPTPDPSDTMLIVAADHPSLIDARARFAADLRAEQRHFGRASATPKPFASLIERLESGEGSRLAAVVEGRIIGVACAGADGQPTVAVVEPWRGHGVEHALIRAIQLRSQLLLLQ